MFISNWIGSYSILMIEEIIRDWFVLVTKSSCYDGKAVMASGLNGMQAAVRKKDLL